MSTNIVVPVKYVPDAQKQRTFRDDLTVDRTDSILSELDEYPLEAALALREAAPEAEVSIVAVTIGPEAASGAVKKALQMGADAAFHVADDALAGSDALGTAAALAAVIRHVGEEHGGVDLVLTGLASTDGEMSVMPAMLAEHLDFALVTRADGIAWVEGTTGLALTRPGADATQTVAVSFPAVVSVTDQANEPRYPNFKAIMAAKKKPSAVLTLADIGVDPASVGRDAAAASVRSASERPPREAGTMVHDDGEAGTALADFLAQNRLL
ncbi:electron transfer flavoprotein subunit beta/FixA family protein [Kocuria marina]|uniref:electron transfer flavoprotein subunit beta/FixA family protein n=1 Tax=Kocuria marina TaxID=223184 RepID=UPI0022DF629F|nr:electron transfer flavoprotein subunit beta [Kocuria marina]